MLHEIHSYNSRHTKAVHHNIQTCIQQFPVSTTRRHKGEGGAKVQLHSLATWALDEGEWLTSRPGHLTPEK